MKQKDIALIAVVVFVSATISLVVTKLVITPPKNRQQAVEVVQPISAAFSQPDTRYFNNKAFDPTKLITIGNSTNPNPFNSPQ